jgi:hypothetical protein
MALGDFDRSPRIIGDRRVSAGQDIEEDTFTDIGVADEDDFGKILRGRG